MGSFVRPFTTINFLPFYSNNHFAAAHCLYCSPSRPVSTFKFIKASGLSSYLHLEKEENKKGDKMTIGSTVRIYDKKLVIDGRTILSNVPNDVILTSNAISGSVDGAFVGADFENSDYRHAIPIGTLRDTRFMASFRFKLWWMSQKMGTEGSEIPLETQFLLLESKQNKEDNTIYIVFLPLIEGSFRASLQGNSNNQIELCLESGDNNTKSSSFTHALYIGYSNSDPFSAISNAIHIVKQHLNTFKQRHEKKLPSIVDYFGWCTWDAFYQEVTQEGVEAGLSTLTSSDTPCKFVIIDDGWQSVAPDNLDSITSSLNRLTDIKENEKFRNKEDPSSGIKSIVKIAKEKYGLHNVYVWHAITGYWGGVKPGEYGSKMQFPKVSEGVMENEPWMKTDVLTLNGVGLVSSKNVYKFYDELHEYLSKAGVDGVKVDVQCVLETLGDGNGGRVVLTQHFHQALDASVAKHFPDNGCIACMSHNTDALYCSKQTAIVRASDDFYPRDPVSHTIHIASVAYNSVFLGEFMQPDWDMFHSLHPAAEYHASARAISGGPIYVSDAPGKHNFELLKKLVLPDGSILRARLPARPTSDCLFTDTTRDNISLLKIWNMNKYTGVLGIYNCQGAAWSSTEKKNAFHPIETETLSCDVKGNDVHLISEAANDLNWNGDCVLYKHGAGELVILPHGATITVSLKVLEHVIFTVSPIEVLAPGYKFAPLGLGDMYNGGGAIEGLSYQIQTGDNVALICVVVKGCGKFVAYSSVKPKKCSMNSSDMEFSYDPTCGLLSFNIESMPESERIFHQIVVLV